MSANVGSGDEFPDSDFEEWDDATLDRFFDLYKMGRSARLIAAVLKVPIAEVEYTIRAAREYDEEQAG